jgi:hypothetical protein
MTMELSTSMPRATTSPAMEICCNPNPILSTISIPMMIDKGMAIMTTSDERNPMARNMKIPTRTIPWSRFNRKLVMR